MFGCNLGVTLANHICNYFRYIIHDLAINGHKNQDKLGNYY